MTLFDMVGFLGMAMLLSAFLLNQLKIMSVDAMAYQLLNIFGAYLLSYYAYVLTNTPFLILEFVWGSFALWRLLMNLFGKRSIN